MLAAALTINVIWILIGITVISFFVMCHFGKSQGDYDFFSAPFAFGVWIILNLVMWLIYFIVV
tara:strand:+ start:45471 stop:45659 length:189 start_codon:yes stop_codon:yes gene_type:complete